MTKKANLDEHHLARIKAYLRFLAKLHATIYYSQLFKLVFHGSKETDPRILNDYLHVCAAEDLVLRRPLYSSLVIYKRNVRAEIKSNSPHKEASPKTPILIAGIGIAQHLGEMEQYPQLKGITPQVFDTISGRKKRDLIRTFNLHIIEEQERVYKQHSHSAAELLKRYENFTGMARSSNNNLAEWLEFP